MGVCQIICQSYDPRKGPSPLLWFLFVKAGVVGKKIAKDKARRGDEEYTIRIKSRYLNLIEFGARKQRRACQLKHGERENYTNMFL